jgi:MoaA/NifB/PqqE/SkfB family radical SAM enzyme
MKWKPINNREMELPDWFLDVYWYWRRLAEPLYAHWRSKGDSINQLKQGGKYPLNRVFAASTHTCNARCGFCAYPIMRPPYKVLDMDLFENFVSQFAEMGGKYVNLTPTFGEPLIDYSLSDKIAFARSKGLDVFFTTNAILLAQKAKAICDAGVTGISVSLPSFDRDEYLRVYRVDKLEEVYQGILAYLDVRKAGQKLSLQFRHACRPSLILKHTRFKEIKQRAGGDLKWEFTYGFDNWMGQLSKESLPKGLWFRHNKFGLHPCRWALSLTLEPSGYLRLCGCRYAKDYSPDMIVGHLSEGLQNVWDNKASKILDDFYLGKLTPTCQKCLFYQAERQNYIGITKFGNCL